MRRVNRGDHKKMQEATGTVAAAASGYSPRKDAKPLGQANKDPFHLTSDEDDQEYEQIGLRTRRFAKQEQKQWDEIKKQEQLKNEEHRLDKIIRGGGSDPNGMPIEEKRQLAEVLQQSFEESRGNTPDMRHKKNDHFEHFSPLRKSTPNLVPGSAEKESDDDSDDYEVVTDKQVAAKCVKRKVPQQNKANNNGGLRQKTLRRNVKNSEPYQETEKKNTEVKEDVTSFPEKETRKQGYSVSDAIKRSPVNTVSKNRARLSHHMSPNKKPLVIEKIEISSDDEDNDEEQTLVEDQNESAGKKTSRKRTSRQEQPQKEKKPKMSFKVEVNLKIHQPESGKLTEDSTTADESTVDENRSQDEKGSDEENDGEKNRAEELMRNSEPYSGVSASPDIFATQPERKEEDGDLESAEQVEGDDETQEITLSDGETGGSHDEQTDVIDEDETQEMMEGPDGIVIPVIDNPIIVNPDGSTPINKSRHDSPIGKKTVPTAATHGLKQTGTTVNKNTRRGKNTSKPNMSPIVEVLPISVKATADSSTAHRTQAAEAMSDGPNKPATLIGSTEKDKDMLGSEDGFDVYAATATYRKDKGGRKTPVNAGNTESIKSVEEDASELKQGQCPYCKGTPQHSPYKALVNKRALKRKLFDDPQPYFTPPGQDPVHYAKIILGYFRTYHAKLREAQKKSQTKIMMCPMVKEGKHCTGNLFARVRGQAERKPFVFDDSDESDALPDIPTKLRSEKNRDVGSIVQSNSPEYPGPESSTNVVTTGDFYGNPQRCQRKRVNQRVYSIDDDNDSDEDFVPDGPKTSRGTGGKKQVNRGRGRGGRGRAGATLGIVVGRQSRRKLMQNEIVGSQQDSVSQYFKNEKKPLQRKKKPQPKHKPMDVEYTETQTFDLGVELYEINDDELVPPTQLGQNDKREVITQHSDTTATQSTQVGDQDTKDQQQADSDTRNVILGNGDSRSNSPILKLSGGNTMAYDDDSSNDFADAEVTDIMKADNEESDSLSKGQAGEIDKLKKEDQQDDIRLFEEIEEPPKSNNRGSRKRGVKRVNKQSTGAVQNKRPARDTRTKSKSPDKEVKQEADDGGAGRERDGMPGSALHDAVAREQGGSKRIIQVVQARRPLRDRVGAPGGFVGHSPERRNAQPMVYEVKSADVIECPMCSKKYHKDVIAHHAATCEGQSTPTEDEGGYPRGLAAQQQPIQHNVQTRPAGGGSRQTRQNKPAAAAEGRAAGRNSDEEDKTEHDGQWATLFNTQKVPTVTGLEGYRIPKVGEHQSQQQQQQPKTQAQPNKEAHGNCPICNGIFPQTHLEVHVNECLNMQEEPEPPPQQQQQQEARRTRNNNNQHTRPMNAEQQVWAQRAKRTQRQTRTPSPVVLDSDDDDDADAAEHGHS